MATNTKFGKIVWAKVKGSCPWPAKGVDPSPGIKRPVKKGNWHFVRFYGSNDHAWVEYDTHIWPYKEYRMRYGDKDKAPALFRDGLKVADQEYEKLSAEDLPSSDNELMPAAPNTKRKSVKVPKPGRPTKPTNTDSEKPSAKKPATANTTATATQKRKAPSHSVEEKPDAPLSKQKSPGAAARLTAAKTNGPSGDANIKVTDIPENLTKSPTKSPKLPTRTLSSSPRRSEIKAQIYEFDDTVSSQLLSNKKGIKPTVSPVGFIGLGAMGVGMVKNLVKHGHKVCVWNKTKSKYDDVRHDAVKICDTPADIISSCDITFACLADPFAVKEVLFCRKGVIEAMGSGKAFIDMTTVDVETATDADYQVRQAGGDYLEAPVSGTKTDAANGSLLILAAGNEALYNKCRSCFQAMSKKSYFLGTVGYGARMALCINSVNGTVNAAVAEGMALAERVGLKQTDLLDVLHNSQSSSPLVAGTSKAILAKNFPAQLSMKHIQKDMRLAIEMADMYDQPLHVAASANELYKRGKSLGLSHLDMSAVYKVASK